MSGNRHGLLTIRDFDGCKSKKGDKIGVLVDMDNKHVRFYKNSKYLGIYQNLDSNSSYYAIAHLFYCGDKISIISHEKIPSNYNFNSNIMN
jgi:hypothetical protein